MSLKLSNFRSFFAFRKFDQAFLFMLYRGGDLVADIQKEVLQSGRALGAWSQPQQRHEHATGLQQPPQPSTPHRLTALSPPNLQTPLRTVRTSQAPSVDVSPKPEPQTPTRALPKSSARLKSPPYSPNLQPTAVHINVNPIITTHTNSSGHLTASVASPMHPFDRTMSLPAVLTSPRNQPDIDAAERVITTAADVDFLPEAIDRADALLQDLGIPSAQRAALRAALDEIYPAGQLRQSCTSCLQDNFAFSPERAEWFWETYAYCWKTEKFLENCH